MFSSNTFKTIHCPDFNVGLCNRGPNCWFSHAYRPAVPLQAEEQIQHNLKHSKLPQPEPTKQFTSHKLQKKSTHKSNITSQVKVKPISIITKERKRILPIQRRTAGGAVLGISKSSSNLKKTQTQNIVIDTPETTSSPTPQTEQPQQPLKTSGSIFELDFIPLGSTPKPTTSPDIVSVAQNSTSQPNLKASSSLNTSNSTNQTLLRRKSVQPTPAPDAPVIIFNRNLIPPSDYPHIPFLVKGKIAKRIRQTMLDKFLDELLLVKQGRWQEAIDEAKRLEDEQYKNSKSKVVYSNLCSRVIAKLKSEKSKTEAQTQNEKQGVKRKREEEEEEENKNGSGKDDGVLDFEFAI